MKFPEDIRKRNTPKNLLNLPKGRGCNMINLKIYCSDCKIPYQVGLFQFIFRNKGCPICHNNKIKFAFGKWDKIR